MEIERIESSNHLVIESLGHMKTIFVTVICLAFACTLAGAQTTQPLAVRADTIHTMSSAIPHTISPAESPHHNPTTP